MKVVLITGAASGIGLAVARAFAQRDCAVVLGDIVEDRLRSVEQAIRADGGVALGLATDVRDDTSVRALVAAGIERFGRFDVVCPNAGICFPDTPLEETTDDVVAALLDVNIRGVIHVLRAALPHIPDGGAIILTSSTTGLQGYPGAAVYAATKIATIGLGRSLALEVSPRRIRVNMVCPGGVDTPLTRATIGSDPDHALAESAKTNPLGRIAQPEDIADAFTFLASNEARYINGVALRVDGGDCLLGAL